MKLSSRIAVLDHAPKHLVDNYLYEFIDKLNSFYLAQDLFQRNSLLLAAMKSCCLSINPDPLDNQALTSVDLQVKGVFSSEARECNDLRDEIMNFTFENFRLLLAYEITGFIQKDRLRYSTLANLIQTYMINARIQRNPYLLQPPLTSEQFAELKQQVSAKVKEIKLSQWQSRLPADYPFALTHAVLAYAYQEGEKLRFAELEQMLEVIYQYLLRYSFLNRWLGLQIYLTSYVNYYYPGIYLEAPLWFLDIEQEQLREQALECLISYVREEVNLNLGLQEQLASYAKLWLDREDQDLDFVFFSQQLPLLDFSSLAQAPFPNLYPGLEKYSLFLPDIYHATCCNLLHRLNDKTLKVTGYQSLERIEEGLNNLEVYYQSRSKVDERSYLWQKINAPHKAYSKQTLKAYRQVAQRLAIAPGYLEAEQQAWLKRLWQKISKSII
ncbi:hypothetical protein [Psittacicella gerlachiana]|uniref:Uncharacterized protein n=1 Tax=Psittacicella gerlachiana TaxID=2028574 RepID=A0A3A1YK50_9GAMM|nr:hypothetical protein [Psittacicella gerlachiana]RIY37961.1 hypothetical protein CKF59_01055 [Psittacicella gerlachiana]